MTQPETSACRFPDRKPYTSYVYGCRCPRCRAGKALYMRQSNGNAREGGVAVTKRRWDRLAATR